MKKFVLALSIGMVITLIAALYMDNIEASLSQSVIRLHVLANSDSESDQALKLKVRDRIIKEFGPLLDSTEDIEVSKQIILSNLSNIDIIARDEIELNGYDYDVKVTYGKSDFPTKIYGNVTLPAGTYDALKVDIGDAEGKNWWCVLFPPLCFVDATTVEMDTDSQAMLKDNLGESSYNMVTNSSEMPVEIKFKAYEIWQSGKAIFKTVFANAK